jgi:hypothetical protein
VRTATQAPWVTRIPWALVGVVEGALWGLAVGLAGNALLALFDVGSFLPLASTPAGALVLGVNALLEPGVEWGQRRRRLVFAAVAAVVGFVFVWIVFVLVTGGYGINGGQRGGFEVIGL